MRITYSSGVRNDLLQVIADQTKWGVFDTNHTVISKHFNTGVSPHAKTLRTTYTVPANKKALLVCAQGGSLRQSAASASQHFTMSVELTPNGGAAQVIFYNGRIDANIENYIISEQQYQIPMVEGDKIDTYTQDNSTGGAIYFNLGFTILEADA